MVIKLPKCDTWRDRRMETYSCKFAATVKLSLKTCETLNCDIYYKIGGLFCLHGCQILCLFCFNVL